MANPGCSRGYCFWVCIRAADASEALVSLELKDIDVKTAIESLFRGTDKNFAIDSDVTGTNPQHVNHGRSLQAALKSLTKDFRPGLPD